MEFEYVTFIQFEDAAFGDYCLPARVIAKQPVMPNHTWVQYLLPDTGPIRMADLEAFIESDASGVLCKLLPLSDQFPDSILEKQYCTVSYSFNPCDFTTFVCDGMWCDKVAYVTLKDYEHEFSSQFLHHIMMDVELFYGEEDRLCLWNGDRTVLRYLNKVLH